MEYGTSSFLISERTISGLRESKLSRESMVTAACLIGGKIDVTVTDAGGKLVLSETVSAG